MTLICAAVAACSGEGDPSDDTPAACDQTRFGYSPSATTNTIAPSRPVQPYYQWQSNNGYCGEVSLLQGGMNNGFWASQYNVRLLCANQSQGDDGFGAGTPLLQSGPDGYCSMNTDDDGNELADPASQLLLDAGDVGQGENSVLTCANNAGLEAVVYKTPDALDGLAAFQDFIVWMKQQLIAGHYVVTGVLDLDGENLDYDHIVSVVRIGTNHAANDPSYYEDDVLYFDDHGLYTFEGLEATDNPAVPPGAGDDSNGCVPYVYGIRVGDLGQSRDSFDSLANGQPYALAIPDRSESPESGGVLNYAFAVTGPLDDDHVTLPVVVTIKKTATEGVDNPSAPTAAFNYESPYIGTKDDGSSCTNEPPSAWMDLTLQVEVQGLSSGTRYNLYEYVFDGVQAAAGTDAALPVPRSRFNANAALATAVISFTASGTTQLETVTLSSDQVVVFRAVPASAP